ncbi:TH1 domain-containing protein [Plasmodiophora brassicae]
MSTSAASQDLMYGGVDDAAGVKLGQLRDLIAALDELSIDAHRDDVPRAVLNDVKDLYALLRAAFEQVTRGGVSAVRVTRQDLVDRIQRIRHAMNSTITTTTTVTARRSRSPSPSARLFEHIPGSQYCRPFFHTEKIHGRQYHTPGVPNDPPRSRQVRRAKSAEPRRRKVTIRSKGRSGAMDILVERTDLLERRLEAELRRELRAEELLERLRYEDRHGFQAMLDKLDYIGECLCSRKFGRTTVDVTPPPPSPSPGPRVVVDNNRITELEKEIDHLTKQWSQEKKSLENRIKVLCDEITASRQDTDDLRKSRIELENEIARLRATESDVSRERKHQDDIIRRLEDNVKRHERGEKRLAKREKELIDDLADAQRRLEEMKTALSLSKQNEADLIAAARANSTPIVKVETVSVPVEPLHSVVSKVLAKYYLSKFRKEHQVRKELQVSLDTMSTALERCNRLHGLEITSVRNQSVADITALKNVIDEKDVINSNLQNQLDRLKVDHVEMERRLTATLESDKRRSSDEITALQMQLMVVNNGNGKAAEPHVDLAPFNRMCADAFQGDYLRLEDAPSVLHIMFSQGDERVLFSDRIEKINHRNFREKRVLLIANNAIYLLMPKGWESRRIMKIEDIDKVTMSRRCGDHFVIHHRNEEDIFIVSSKRLEIVYHLMNVFKRKTQNDLPYHFAERFYVEDHDMHYRLVEIPDTVTVKLGKSQLMGPT